MPSAATLWLSPRLLICAISGRLIGPKVSIAEERGSPTVFVSPQVRGWTFVVGWALPQLDDSEDRKEATLRALLELLGEHFEEVQFFATHRVVEYHAFARRRHRVMERMFAYVGESGEVTSNRGVQTTEERAFGFPDLSGLAPQEATDKLFESEEDGLPTRSGSFSLPERGALIPRNWIRWKRSLAWAWQGACRPGRVVD